MCFFEWEKRSMFLFNLHLYSLMIHFEVSYFYYFPKCAEVSILHTYTLTCYSNLIYFQVLMATISLRRTKDKGLIGLPIKTIETCYVELSREERELYDHMEGEAKNIVQDYIGSRSIMRNYSTILSIILRLRQICTDSALCPSDIKSLLPSNNIEGIENDVKHFISFLFKLCNIRCLLDSRNPSTTIWSHCLFVYGVARFYLSGG